MTQFLFVYGTLMQGCNALRDWQEKAQAKFVGKGRISGRLYDLGEYPGAITSVADSGEWVVGEIYELSLPAESINFLDEYEGFIPADPSKSLYVRKVAPVNMDDGRVEDAWVYFYNRSTEGARLIQCGDYLAVNRVR